MSSDPIRDFYAQHPYPPPVDNLDRARDEWLGNPHRARAEFHLYWPDRPYRANLDVLVAGCGTWQAARFALTHPGARVVGIDVSPASIEHTRTLQRQYRLDNLDVRLLAVEDAAELAREFDLVICTGVLHHLADPEAGLHALRSVLAPGGAMYLMVYAPYGRAGIYMMQDYCRRLGVGTSDVDIDEVVRALQAMSPDHPVVRLLQGSRDAQDPAALADALLNPRDRAYSVPQLYAFLESGGLELARWYWQAQYLPQCGAIAATPHAARLAALAPPDQHAAMELWRGTITAHSLIARRPETGRPGSARRFDDECGMGAVPIRLPWTRLVEESLPPGAAAVLINRGHHFRDLVLILSPGDRRLFDAIDGRRTVAEIIDSAKDVTPARARTFLEQLWHYDHVVFDASATPLAHAG